MNLKYTSLIATLLASSTVAFTVSPSVSNNRAVTSIYGLADDDIESAIDRAAEYQPGAAQTPFAERFRHLKGAPVKTVGEAFSTFTSILGTPVNALYKNMMTDIVGITHLTVINARFARDPIWSLGMVSSLDLLLKNYPEAETRDKIVSSLYEACELNQSEILAEAETMKAWIVGKSQDDVLA